jgi:membrane protein
MGSLVVVLVWVYYSAQILFFGAQFTCIYASRFGVEPQPVRSAKFVPIDQKHHRKTGSNRK